MSAPRHEADVRAFLRDAVAELLGAEPSTIDEHRPLTELGIGSRDAVGVIGELEDFLDREIDATLVFKTPTIAGLAAALTGGATDSGAAGTPPGTEAGTETRTGTGDGTGTGPGAEPGAASGAAAGPADDPVVVVGLGCRLPGGVEGPDAFWELLRTGRDVLGEVPEGRWEQFGAATAAARRAVAGTTRRGGYLDDVEHFDADYFGISPREAELMDPQQRMLLEVTVEALEHAGIPPASLRGTDTGVFVGMSNNEYGYLTMGDPARVDAWTATGAAFAIAANRISYLLDLRGPSMTTDTACSSSLVALHQARRAIEGGEITTAVVAGVNLLLSPSVTMTFDQAGATAPAGGCKPFSADADGIARAEGCGVVVVKRLSAALADGDRPLAVVRGSAVNSDGRSNGITAPNPDAQEAVLRAAYREAGLDPSTVDYVEAHGTGTLLGDPIEAGALGAVLGRDRAAEAPLGLGSVKSNLGHLEAAAGVAGLLKVVLAMRHGVIPPSLHFTAPNPHIRFDEWRLDVVTQARPWPRYGGVARAGVSGFGFGGTNAHVILEEWPAPVTPPAAPADDGPVALVLSAADDARVRAQAGSLATWLSDTYDGAVSPLGDVAHTLVRRRDRHASCTVVAARGREALTDALRRHAAGEEPAAGTAVLPAVPPTARRRLGTPGAVWVFSGIGSQWAGMGQRLLADEPAFAAAIDELEPHVRREAGFSLRELVASGSRADGVTATQVALFGMQVALAALWRSYGARPAAVVGNSMGEITGAVVAGALDVADGVRIMTVRSRIIEEHERVGTGGMAVVELSDEEFARVADRFPDVSVCVHASPTSLTVGATSNAAQLQEFLGYVESLGRNTWPLKYRAAAHSAAVEEVLDELAAGIAGITPREATVPFYSTANDDPRAPVAFDVAYWRRNMRQPVRFAQAIAACAEDGHAAFVEVSPHPIAVTPIRQSVAGRVGPELLVLPTLRRGGDDTVTFRAHALALHAAGLLDADVVVPHARQADLPLPAWQRRRFWVGGALAGGPAGAGVTGGHPLLGLDVDLPEGDRHVWRGDAGTAPVAWLEDHRVFGVPVLPVAAYAEMALTAGRRLLAPDSGPDAVVLTDLELHEVMVLGEHTEVTTSVTRGPGDGTARVDVYARPPGALGDRTAAAMTRHATATVLLTDGAGTAPAVHDPEVLDLRGADGTRVDLYARLAELGHLPGPSFRALSDARVSASGVALARVELPATVAADVHYTVHPVLLDACLQALVVSALHLAESTAEAADGVLDDLRSRVYLPVSVGRVRVSADPGRGGVVTAELRAMDDAGDGLSGTLRLVADDGTPLLEVQDVYLRRVDRSELPEAPAGTEEDDGWPGAEALRAQNPAVARGLLMERLRSRVAWVMGHRPDEVDVTVPLSSLGVDSLMAVRAKNAMEHDVGVVLPVRLLLQGASLADLEAHLAAELGIDVAPPPQAPAVRQPSKERPHYVDPRDATERWLTTVWEKVLGVERPGVSTPLATLGADEARYREVLLLVHDRMASQIGAGEEVHGTFDDEAFLAAPTIEQQGDLIRHRLDDNHGSPLRVLAEGEPGEPPLFLFHPAGGTTSVYFSLVAHLDPAVPVYGFERLDSVPMIEDKIATYVALIREIQPHGPYRLGGWSFGGALAYETARYFRAVGEEVQTLFMIDSILARKDGTDEREMLAGRFRRFKAYLAETYGLDLDLDVDALVLLPEDEQIATFMRVVQEAGLNLSPELLEHQRTSYEDARTAERFTPQPYEGHVILYRATERGLTTTLDPRYARTEDALGWDVYCPSLEIVKVPGNHTSLIDPPHVDVMAQHLRQVLSEVVRHA